MGHLRRHTQCEDVIKECRGIGFFFGFFKNKGFISYTKKSIITFERTKSQNIVFISA